ncbi:MAG: serine--tRNA ligase [Candidatus Odinarchaeum yellowstonii]|uniref:Type-2 serine--tRNA ligase n=1 Tax=Odinarchaeota yellowstonii (strain LCB_4) TaxID=1841599 RepID=A0AAF0D2N9_ODILC|nr:MAG: serine--tRNA ligase [Candidatus Odinarchaeum yellowstonii]
MEDYNMRFDMNARIIFNKDLTSAKEFIAQLIEEVNKTILLKGVPQNRLEEGARISDWSIKGDELHLTIVSGRYLRAHSALLRIYKLLSKEVGSRFKTGARSIIVDEYTGVMDLPSDAEFSIPKIPTIKSIERADGSLKIYFANLDEAALRGYEIDRAIKLIQSLTLPSLTERVTKIPPGTVIRRSKPREHKFKEDPTLKALELKWLEEFPGKGQFFYTPPITKLYEAIKTIFVKEVGEKLGFQECLFPKLIPLEIMDKMRYLEGICEGMFYCSAPERNPEFFEDLKAELYVTRKIPYKKLRDALKDPYYALSAAQCEPFYNYLGDKKIKIRSLPIKYMDHSGYTFRYEAGGARGLERAFEFQRLELVWAALPEEAEKIRDETLMETERVADEILELEWWTEVGDDPFYLVGRFSEDQEINLPDVPKYELRAALPYKGEFDKKNSIATSSFNVHGQHYVKNFSTKTDKGVEIWTGCTGIGLTRWLVAFLAQHGFNRDEWPKKIIELTEPFPPAPDISA